MKRPYWILAAVIVTAIYSAALAAPQHKNDKNARRKDRDPAVQRRLCRTQMKVLANVEQTYRNRSKDHRYTSDLNQLLMSNGGDLVGIPKCPAGGHYSVVVSKNGTMLMVHCSIAAHDAGAKKEPRGYTPGKNSE